MSWSCRLSVALADDHAVVRAGYRRLLELEPDIDVVAEFGNGAELESRLAAPDGAGLGVLVLDLSMPGLSGIELLQRLRTLQPALPVLVFTMHDSAVLLERALGAGAAGYVTKSSAPAVLIDAVRRVARGATALSPDMAALLQAHASRHASHHRLSDRERDVLAGLVAGRSLGDIAAALNVSVKTVANYQALIRQKLGVSGAVDLWQYARRHGLVEP